MKKVLFVATVVKTHIMEFHLPYLKALKEAGWQTAVAARNDYENPADCVIPYCDEYYDIPFERSPFSVANIAAYKALKSVIEQNGYDVIHCHTPVGGALTRLAARKARRSGTKVFYTAHGFHFCKGAPLKNWLVFYPAEKFLSRFTDVLFTINKEDFERAKHFYAKEAVYVPGVGIDIDKFRNTQVDRAEKRKSLGIPADAFLLLSVGELNRNKNHELVIRALAELKNPAVHYAIAGSGELKDYLSQLAASLGLVSRVHVLGYRNDTAELYKTADVLVHPSFREGLPVAVMEALASGLPVIATNIRGSADLVEDGVNGYLIDNDVSSLCEKIKQQVAKKHGDITVTLPEKYDLGSVISEVMRYYCGI